MLLESEENLVKEERWRLCKVRRGESKRGRMAGHEKRVDVRNGAGRRRKG